MEAICCECGKKLDFFKSYAFTKPSGETVLGHKHCVMTYAERYNKIQNQKIRGEMKYTAKDLDEKLNEDETLLQYIQNGFREFYDDCITREKLKAMTDEQFNMLVEELDYLWSK